MNYRPALGILLALTLTACDAGTEGGAAPSIRLKPGPDADMSQSVFEVVDLDRANLSALRREGLAPDRLARIFTVRQADGPSFPEDRDGAPVSGRYEIDGTTLRFLPAEPLEAGASYWAAFDPSGLPHPPPSAEQSVTRALFRIHLDPPE